MATSLAVMAKSKKSKPAKPQLPPSIFGHTHAEYSLPVLKKILAIFGQELIKNQRRTTLLQRLATLEPSRSLVERDAIKQLLRRGAPLTREAVQNFPQILEEVEDEEVQEVRPARRCDACTDLLNATQFRQDKITPACEHEVTLCEECLAVAINIQLRGEESDWGALHCPLCPVESRAAAILLPKTVRRYAAPAALAEYVAMYIVLSLIC